MERARGWFIFRVANTQAKLLVLRMQNLWELRLMRRREDDQTRFPWMQFLFVDGWKMEFIRYVWRNAERY